MRRGSRLREEAATLRTLAFLALALSLSALPATASYLQVGVDAARTGNSPDAGPEWPDVALQLELPGVVLAGSVPLVDGDAAYAVTTERNGEGWNSTVWRIGLADGAVFPSVRVDGLLTSVAADGERFYAGRTTYAPGTSHREPSVSLEAYDRRTGELLWSVPQDLAHADAVDAGCAGTAVAAGRVVFACYDFAPAPVTYLTPAIQPTIAGLPGGGGILNIVRVLPWVVSLDPANGGVHWRWDKTASEEQAWTDLPLPGQTGPSGRYGSLPLGVSLNGPYAHVATIEGTTREGVAEGFVWTLSQEDGAFVSYRASGSEAQDTSQTDPLTKGSASRFPTATTPTGDGNVAYMRLGRQILCVNPTNPRNICAVDIGERDESLARAGSGLALVGQHLYATSVQSLYRMDVLTTERQEVTLGAAANESWSPSGLVVDARGTLFARTRIESGESAVGMVVRAYDAATLDETWSYAVSFPPFTLGGTPDVLPLDADFAVGSGVLVLVHSGSRTGGDSTIDGTGVNVTVLGRTLASPFPVLDATTEYPTPGEDVVVDLSGSRGGLRGTATAYRADWGDGTATEWQPDPILRHAYAEPGERTARFSVRNAAGQTASETVTFHVGEPAPNVLSNAFARENQERTFFILGLALTAIGGAVGLARLERRRGRLKRELAAIDAVVQRTRDDPPAFEAALAERRARANGLLVDGKIDEAQFAVLKGRLEEVAGQVRLSALDERFHFLPYGMVQTLREMLADGKITRWEREHFVSALERDTMLNAEQKEKVRDLIEGWFQRDAGTGRP